MKSNVRLSRPILPSPAAHAKNSLTGNQLKQLLRTWLSPADPSTNHNIARKVQHDGTAVWLFQGGTITEWKSTGSLLWIHGKRACLLRFLSSDFLQTPIMVAGSGKSVIWFVVLRLIPVASIYSSLVPPLSRTLWTHAKPDQPSSPIFASISRTSENKPVTT